MNKLFQSPIATSPQNRENLKNLKKIQQENENLQNTWNYYRQNNITIIQIEWMIQHILLQQTKIRLARAGFVSEQEEGLCQTLEQTNLRNTALRSCVLVFE